MANDRLRLTRGVDRLPDSSEIAAGLSLFFQSLYLDDVGEGTFIHDLFCRANR
jgi:hypothetical protein